MAGMPSPPATPGGHLAATEVQAVLVGILREIDAVCRASGIAYCLIGGGCLGIVRHDGGFVPWDDDLDIAVWASDMPRFVAAMAALPPHLAVRAKSGGPNPAFQVSDTRTRTIGSGYEEDVGIFVDVLPMMLWRSLTWKRLDRALRRLAGLAWNEGSPPASNAAKAVLMRLGVPRLAGWFCARVFRPLVERHDRHCRRVGRGVVTAAYGRSWVGQYDHDIVLPLREASFCGMPVPVPRDLHAFLRQRYGADYMTLPPEDRRWKHFAGAVRIGGS